MLFKKTGGGGFPVLTLDDIVLFPGAVITVFALKKPDILVINEALRKDRLLFVLCNGNERETGSVGRIIQQMRLPDGSFRVMLEGQYRAVLTGREERDGITFAVTEPVTDEAAGRKAVPAALEALARNVREVFARYAKLTRKVPAETQVLIERTESPERTCDTIAHVLQINTSLKRELIGIAETEKRLTRLLEIIESENEILGLQEKISGDVKKRIDKRNREFVLREQLKEINRELGNSGDAASASTDEFAELQNRIAAKTPPSEVMERVEKEIGRLKMLQPFSPESGVLRTYLEWIADLPWGNASEDHAGLDAAEAVLEAGHYGLRKPKERILEFIAVRALMSGAGNAAGSSTAPILCFVGPPGTGKTSLGSSVAEALGRKFVRASLGGLRDEAEIRGHRKTYVGALPGKILQSMRKAGTANPVFLLDEIDKMASDYRGDPAAALLEVLDPEQNHNFTDNYLEMPYDLSSVLFIATANSLHNIPYPLLDRLEVIEIPGYSDREKLAIAKKFLLPKALLENALAEADIGFSDNAILSIIHERTMESGIRSLERELNRAVRRLARDAVKQGRGQNGGEPLSGYQAFVSGKRLEKLLGAPKFQKDVLYREARTGVANGLAWTETGGTMLAIESLVYPGKGELIITGNIGDVMKESARIALSYLRGVKDRYAIAVENFSTLDYHFHVPEGAIPKDGPSAGITLAVSLLSTLTQKPPRPLVAMTGELTLTGRILPIGGLKEKLLAAIRGGMTWVLIPAGNREDWKELDAEIKNALAPRFVQNAEEAFAAVFERVGQE
jgi:ATP-dependent Lon protease